MSGPTVGHEADRLAYALDRVFEPEPRATNLADTGVESENVVEAAREPVADVRLRRGRLDAVLDEAAVTARKAREVPDASDLEPVQVHGVVRDPLRVGLAEADADVFGEMEVAQRSGLWHAREKANNPGLATISFVRTAPASRAPATPE